MKIYSNLSNIIFVLCILLITGCSGLFGSDPTPTVPIIVTPTTASQDTQVIQLNTIAAPESTGPLEPTLAAATQVSPVDPTATPVVLSTVAAPTLTPTAVASECVRPGIADGWYYFTYNVVAGDTIFSIGQKARPPMTVDDIAAANCLTDVNRIEVGQELILWHSPTAGPVSQSILFEDTPFGQFATYAGPLAFGEMAFTFTTDQPQNFNIVSRSGQTLIFTVDKADSSSQIGKVGTIERHYLELESRGRQFFLPEAGEYRVTVAGNSGVLLDFTLLLGALTYPELGEPDRISFPAGATSLSIAGTTPEGRLNRYVFGAAAGQVVGLEVSGGSYPVALIIEDLNENLIYRSDFQAPPHTFTLPADGDYLLTVCHCASEFYGFGDYAFGLTITTPTAAAPTATPTPAAPAATPGAGDFVSLTLEPGMNGWQFASDTGILNDQGKKTFAVYAGEGQILSFIDRSGSSLSFELEKGDGTVQVGSANPTDRNYLDPQSRGAFFVLPETAEYHLHVTGSPGAAYELGLVWGGLPHPTLGIPERIQFEARAVSADISGVTAPGNMNRYVFGAAAGQTVTINFQQIANGVPTHVWLETSAELILLKTELEGFKQIVLPATDDYILTVIHPSGEVYGDGPYSFTLTIE